MEVHLNPDLATRLSCMATQRGRAPESLVQEAIERLVDHEEWFLQQVETGLAAADRGEFIEHREIRDLIDRRYPG